MKKETVDNGKRYRVTYQDHNLYVTVSDNEGSGCPYSVAISYTNEYVNRDLDKQSFIAWTERSCNVALRTIGTEETLRKLLACSMSNLSLVAILFDLIVRYLEGE